MRSVHHKLDIYGTELHLAFDRQGWAALRRMNPNLEPSSDLGVGQVHDSRHKDTDQQHVWVWIDLKYHGDDLAELADSIAHEATHVAHAIFHRHSMEALTGTAEPFAYLVGWVTAWIWRHLPERTHQ